MTVFAPWPAAAWAKASAIRASGKRAVTSRLTPSFGISASARRKGRAAAERADDPQLTVGHVPEVERCAVGS